MELDDFNDQKKENGIIKMSKTIIYAGAEKVKGHLLKMMEALRQCAGENRKKPNDGSGYGKVHKKTGKNCQKGKVAFGGKREYANSTICESALTILRKFCFFRRNVMKKLLSLALALVMVLALAACGESGNDSGDSGQSEPVVLKYSELNSEQTSQYRWDLKFKELVEEKTNGSVQIDIYANGQLSSQDPEAVTNGICDILMSVPSNWSDYYSEIAAVDAPYAITSAEEGIKVFADPDSPVLARANEALASSNVIWLSAYYEGSREMTTTDTPVYSLADLKPLKMRVVNSDLYIQLFKAFGCEATPMAWSEVASGLITGVIDGQENPITGYKEDSLQELQKYCILTHHLPANYGMFMNLNKFNSLTEEQQQAIIEASCEASAWMCEDRAAALEDCRAELEADGMIFIGEEDGLALDEFREAAMSVYDIYADEWGDMVDVIAQAKEG